MANGGCAALRDSQKRRQCGSKWTRFSDLLYLLVVRKGPPCMPLYEYFCKNCDENFTVTMTIAEHEKKNVKCPKCKGTKVVPQFRSFYAKTSRKS
jgi:putative FmdB family regulatory protein